MQFHSFPLYPCGTRNEEIIEVLVSKEANLEDRTAHSGLLVSKALARGIEESRAPHF